MTRDRLEKLIAEAAEYARSRDMRVERVPDEESAGRGRAVVRFFGDGDSEGVLFEVGWTHDGLVSLRTEGAEESEENLVVSPVASAMVGVMWS